MNAKDIPADVVERLARALAAVLLAAIRRDQASAKKAA